MAVQVASGGLSRLILVVGAGYGGTILIQKGKMSELIGELASLVKGIEKSGGEQLDETSDAITTQVRRLAMEVRQLASSSITVYNGESGVSFTSLLAPAAAVGAVGCCYMWWKGFSYKDLMWITKHSMSTAVENLTTHLDNVSDALSRAKNQLTQRITHLDRRMEEQKDLSKNIKESVDKTNSTLTDAGYQLEELQDLISNLGGKMDSLHMKQDYMVSGVEYLLKENACGTPFGSLKPLQKQLKLSGKSRNLLALGTPPVKGLIDIVDSAKVSINDSVEGGIVKGGNESFSRKLLSKTEMAM